ncbi:MAG TPA: GNAT family N-acetyltransferase [Bryobacteraceae bacterium]|nr:GNAT family N-acetyltransferase [Bryobacteraceae bacterium]
MNTVFRRAVLPKEIRSLMLFDRKAFHEHPADWFDREYWQACDPWWMIIENRKVGCCAFEHHVDFQEDVREDRKNRQLRGSLYIVTTGILPSFQGLGFGVLLKSWQLSYARRHGFTRVVTNTRKGNRPMIGLNKRFGFKVLRTTLDYYEDPRESTVVMELQL